jgi:superfamily I DNA/RNA helicase
MLYLPVTANVPFDAGADVVFVDELQDLDALQRRMVVSMARTGALFVGVGDTSQAIFGFRGADCDSMRKVRQETTAVELPLSICYRCPTSHIELARLVAPQIEARDGAPEGLLECYNGNGTLYCTAPHKHGFDCDCATVRRRSLTAAQFQPGDLVLCRSKAPLVKAAYWLIRHGTACTVLGKDIGKGLVAFIDSFRVDSTADLLTKINRLTAQALSRAGEDDDIEDITDRRDVIVAVADACESNDVAELRTKLTHLFSDNTDRASVVTLSTIHRAKGAEADRVWWIDRQRLSLDKNFKHEWRREEEKSIIFVGSTRSRRELRFVCSEFMR